MTARQGLPLVKLVAIQSPFHNKNEFTASQAKDSSSISSMDFSTTPNYDFQTLLGSARAWKEFAPG
ncbi:hypothetical protein M569_00045 [Genlisea aurea]|uniref:Uncharacterized protein n=1 Tax=Genlisea aurea TaxID=192259 RepID=S8D5L8_9LAMI|nr:hypothetical protein M569_00045 [Genlisea aurea]